MKTTKNQLTPYQQGVYRRYNRILEITRLHPERIFNVANDDPAAVVPVLQSMIDQAVRSHVIVEYTFIDAQLNDAILNHVFGRGKSFIKATRSRRYQTLQMMLQLLYPLQKLAILKTFKHVPTNIWNTIAAINDLRNGLAHSFHLRDLKESSRTYKRRNIFTPSGLELFDHDSRDVLCFFEPWIKKFSGLDD